MHCPHSERCPGCPLIGLPYPAQLARKHGALTRALRPYAGLDAAEVRETVGADPTTGFRLRSKLVVGGRALGLFARGTHQVVDIPECRIQTPRVLRVASALRGSLAELAAVSSFDLREVDEGVLVTAAVAPAVTPETRRRLAARIAALDSHVASVAISTRERDAPQLLGSMPEALVGPSELRHGPDPTAPWHYAAHGAFTQAHAGQLGHLHAAIEAELRSLPAFGRPGSPPASRVLELYAGSGGLSLRLSARGFAVTLVEAFAPAARLVERAAREQGLSVRAITSDAGAALTELVRARARFDAVIVNPPRRGLASEVRRLLAELQPERVLYVSCSPATLARDAAHLGRLGYALRRATPFDMIPLSDAVETLAVLEPAAPPTARILAEGPTFVAVLKEPHEPVAPTPGAGGSLLSRVRALSGAEQAVALDHLDAELSGACLFARRPEHAAELTQALEASRTEAVALVRGVIRQKSTLGKQGRLGPDARYERLEAGAGHSLVVVRAPPDAFRDAARAFARFGHPVLGDTRDGDGRANLYFGMRHGLDRSFWHRRALELECSGKALRIEAPPAPDLDAVLESIGAGERG